MAYNFMALEFYGLPTILPKQIIRGLPYPTIIASHPIHPRTPFMVWALLLYPLLWPIILWGPPIILWPLAP